jgi:hypothetical protein
MRVKKPSPKHERVFQTLRDERVRRGPGSTARYRNPSVKIRIDFAEISDLDFPEGRVFAIEFSNRPAAESESYGKL